MRRALLFLILVTLFLLPACNLATELTRWLSLSPTEKTLQLVEAEDRPVRDTYSLAARFEPSAAQPAAQTAPSPANRRVGDKASFWVGDIQSRNYYSITATLQAVTDHAYFWVQDGLGMDLNALQRSASEFESHVYPTTRSYFGSEWTPGVDGDPHIYILNARLTGLRGYFSSADEFTRAINPYSNEHEMIYIDAPPGNDDYLATLAHEFQHMIHWNVNRRQDVWLNEGCAELSMVVNGYNSSGVVPSFEQDPNVQLDAWGMTPGTSLSHYGASYLFFRYLTDHFGGGDLMRSIIEAPFRGPEAVSEALLKHGLPEDFDSVFERWVVANYADERVADPGIYGYPNDKVEVNAQETVGPSEDWKWGSTNQYAADYIKLQGGGGNLTFRFEGAPTVQLTGAAPHSGSQVWWSNRGDDMDTRMTRAVDLSRVSSATLHFWTWYDIEQDYDYGYVAVSDDGGRTWHTLPAQDTTADNPNGTNLGNGFTGISGQEASSVSPTAIAAVPPRDGAGKMASGASSVSAIAQRPSWVQETVDLSAYAGKKILLRFEYVTDDGFNGEGMVIDDISIPEIGYFDNAEADTGWVSEGFIRSNNTLPQKFTVQVLRLGSKLDVQQVSLDSQNKGEITIPNVGGSDPRETVIVISAEAPLTTEEATFSYQVSAY